MPVSGSFFYDYDSLSGRMRRDIEQLLPQTLWRSTQCGFSVSSSAGEGEALTVLAS